MVTRHSVGGGMATGKKTEDLRGKFKKGGGNENTGKTGGKLHKNGGKCLKNAF